MTSLATNSCPACQFANAPSANFCMRCGAPMHPAGGGGLQVGTAATAPAPVPGAATRAASAPMTSRPPSASGAVPRLSSQADSEPDYWLGRLIDGRYRVIARIGQGGMGLVYKVEHQRMGKIAAM